jgi:prepilin-type N-terminal cleavage/methylation domain-containing protein
MKNAPGMAKAQGGFTLIEIAIVLVIIGLLLGGVLQGQQLIENSRVRNAVNDINGTAAAAFSYVDRFDRFPGDDAGAVVGRGSSWPAAAAGNSNGLLTATLGTTFTGAGEGGFFWRNLRSAGFVAGDPSQALAAALPQNAWGGLIGITSDASMLNLTGNKICLSQVPGAAAIALDTQLDDGLGASGRFRATLGASGANTPPTNIALAAVYSEDNIYTVCYRI